MKINAVEFKECNIEKPEYIPVWDSKSQQAWAWSCIYKEIENDPVYKNYITHGKQSGLQGVINYIRYLKANQKEL